MNCSGGLVVVVNRSNSKIVFWPHLTWTHSAFEIDVNLPARLWDWICQKLWDPLELWNNWVGVFLATFLGLEVWFLSFACVCLRSNLYLFFSWRRTDDDPAQIWKRKVARVVIQKPRQMSVTLRQVGFEFALSGAFFVPRKNIKMDFTRNSWQVFTFVDVIVAHRVEYLWWMTRKEWWQYWV
jgi:hypothetical protein